jgi:hypothetical protein
MYPPLATLALLLIAQRPADKPANVDPDAGRVLNSMIRAYRDAHKLEQETAYHREDGSAGGMIRSRLVVQRPNRLFLEVVQQSPDWPTPLLSRFVCDGKSFYSYQQKNGWYQKDKAPKDLKDFDFLALSVEMAALTGNDPMAGLLRQARTVRLAGTETIDGETADVVRFDTSSASQTGELRLFIGREDHLLRRFALESKPIPLPVDKAATPLEPGETAAPPPAATSYSYDVHVMRGREQTKDPFTWVAPAGSFAYQQFPTYIDPKGGRVQAPSPSGTMPDGVKPMKVISIQDLIKNAKKPKKK